MAAPTRLRITVDDLAVSAFILSPIDLLQAGKPVCKSCAPIRTRMTLMCELRRRLRDGWENYSVYQCANCLTQWAVPWLDARESTQP